MQSYFIYSVKEHFLLNLSQPLPSCRILDGSHVGENDEF